VVADAEARRQASNELRIAHSHASITDHLVGLIDAYFVNDKICILMEFCDGGSLADAFEHARAGVKGFPIGPVVVQMCHGLRHMHSTMKQVHRDLKPANCLLTSTGVVKLADFGISKQLDHTDALAVTQVGTTAYMSPERLKGDEYGFASDVWSLGVIILEHLLGEHPLSGASHNFMSLFAAISSGDMPAPPEGTPAPVVADVKRCLRVEPQDRADLDKLLDGEWLRSCGGDVRQPVLAWLMKAAAKRMAQKIMDH